MDITVTFSDNRSYKIEENCELDSVFLWLIIQDKKNNLEKNVIVKIKKNSSRFPHLSKCLLSMNRAPSRCLSFLQNAISHKWLINTQVQQSLYGAYTGTQLSLRSNLHFGVLLGI